MVRVRVPRQANHETLASFFHVKSGLWRLLVSISVSLLCLCTIVIQYHVIFYDKDVYSSMWLARPEATNGEAFAARSLQQAESLAWPDDQPMQQKQPQPMPQQQPHSPPLTDKPIMLLAVFSMRKETNRQQYLRQTIFNTTDPRICTLQQYTAPNSVVRQDCQILYTFLIGTDRADLPRKLVHNETDLSRIVLPPEPTDADIVTLAIEENMNAGKTPSYFRYASLLTEDLARRNIRIDYITKMDSDTMINVTALADFANEYLLPSTMSQYQATFGGLLFEQMYCGGGKHCKKLKGRVYMSGGFYFLSLPLVRHITSPEIYETKHIWFEDMNTGFQVASYNRPISYLAFNTDMFWKHGVKKEEDWRELWAKAQEDPSVLVTGWGAWGTVEGSLG